MTSESNRRPSTIALAAALAAALGSIAAPFVEAQEGAATPDRPDEAEAPDREDASAEAGDRAPAAPGPTPPALPAPTLEGEEPVAPPEPQPAPEPEQPVILHHIGTGDHPEWEDDGETPRDIAFETPGDLRAPTNQYSNVPRAQLPAADPEIPPRTFGLAVAGGYARLLAAEAVDFVRLEERFEARLPEIEILRLGVGATQMVSDTRYLIGGGVRLGFGGFFCDGGWIQCEGVASVQPGVMAGEFLGVRFDLNASLDLRFVLEHLVELSIGGGYSLLGELSLLHVTGQVGFVF